MTGGSLNLASAKGMTEDVINLNPQITFFKKVYKRHTNFGIENIQQDINTTVDFGSSADITITKTGTLISDMYMEFTLPPAAGSGGVNSNDVAISGLDSDGVVSNFKEYAHWVNGVGYAIIDNIKLILNNDTVDKHTGLWYDIWNELSDPNRTEWPLVGKYDYNDRKTAIDKTNSRYYVPLKFYFNRNPGLAIPIFLLNEGDIKIEFTLNSVIDLVNFKKRTYVTTAIDTTVSLSTFKFFTTYIFLEPSEELRISSNLPSEYLIETLDIHDNVSASDLSGIVFENPVKEIVWVFRHKLRLYSADVGSDAIPKMNTLSDTHTGAPKTVANANDTNLNPNDIFNYAAQVENFSGSGYGTYDTFNTLSLKIANQERFATTDATFFRTMQPYKHHSNIPGGSKKENERKKYIYVYSFSLSPEDYQPSGSYNFSATDDKVAFTFAGHDIANYTLSIFTTRYEYLSITRGRISKTNVPIQKAAVAAATAGDSSKSSRRSLSPQRQASTDPRVVRRSGSRTSPKKRYWGGLADK